MVFSRKSTGEKEHLRQVPKKKAIPKKSVKPKQNPKSKVAPKPLPKQKKELPKPNRKVITIDRGTKNTGVSDNTALENTSLNQSTSVAVLEPLQEIETSINLDEEISNAPEEEISLDITPPPNIDTDKPKDVSIKDNKPKPKTRPNAPTKPKEKKKQVATKTKVSQPTPSKEKRKFPFSRKSTNSLTEPQSIPEGINGTRSKFSSTLLKYLGINTVKMVSELQVKNLSVDKIIVPNPVAYTDGFMSKTEFPSVVGFVDNEMFGNMGNSMVDKINTKTSEQDSTPNVEPTDELNKPLFTMDTEINEIDLGAFSKDVPSEEKLETEEPLFQEIKEENLFSIDEDKEPEAQEVQPIQLFEDAISNEETQPVPNVNPTVGVAQQIDFTKIVESESDEEIKPETETATEPEIEFETLIFEEEKNNPIGPISLQDIPTNIQPQESLTDNQELKNNKDFMIEETSKDELMVFDAVVKTAPAIEAESDTNTTHNPLVKEITEEDLFIQNSDSDSMMSFGSQVETGKPSLETKTLSLDSFKSLRPKQSVTDGGSSILAVRNEEDDFDNGTQIILDAINEENIEDKIRNAPSFLDAIKYKTGSDN